MGTQLGFCAGWGRKSLCGNDLRFLTQFGTSIALENSVNSEMDTAETSCTAGMGEQGTILLDGAAVQVMRRRLHELANVFTGVMIAGGLLSQFLEGGALRTYASDICEVSERGCALVREIRNQLLAAGGELEAEQEPGAAVAVVGEPGIS